jgi:hypothetical protein
MYNAQTCQDVFVNKILDKDSGFFVDIGAGTGGLRAHTPGFYSNTYFFESARSWSGLAIDYDENWYYDVKNLRKCSCVCENLLEKNINNVLEEHKCPPKIDYLSIDVDDAQLKVFNDFDFNKYSFRVLTLEHNLFQTFDTCTQNRSEEKKQSVTEEYHHYRNTLNSCGYKLLWGNVILDEYGPVEDWWVDKETYEKYKEYESHDINCKETLSVVFR